MEDFERAKELFFEGIAYYEKEQFDLAAVKFCESLTLVPDRISTMTNLSATLIKQKNFEAAKELCLRTLSIDSASADAWNYLGLIDYEQSNQIDAIAKFDKALTINHNDTAVLNNKGVSLNELGQLDAALACFNRAIALKPDYTEAYYNRGNTLQDLRQLDGALDSYDRALKIKPDYEFLCGSWLHAKMRLCDWRDVENQIVECIKKIERGEKATPSFPVLALVDSLILQRKAADTWVTNKYPVSLTLPSIAKRTRREKIRVGYYSADYHDHATAYLMAELFERHDRNRFELVAFSFGLDQKDRMRKRVSAAFEQFWDVRTKSDKEVALLSRNMEIDIAIDLKGFTQNGRPGIFSNRAAPIQVSYIGYPGTVGAEYIDYLIADRMLIPNACQRHYAEKIVYLPNSYQVNDRKRQIADKRFSREELGLPKTSFVFCCFNNSYKITPRIFDGWMRILKQVDGSVLWLLEDNPTASANLRKESEARGLSVERLIFAKRMPLPEHLARHRAADLFLDTLPYNAHTTASDALWAGLPVLTRVGEAFAGRVAASLLNAIDIPELITTTQDQYEALAVELAANPKRLKKIGEKLARNRLTKPLFDTELFTKHIEDAYVQMYERYQADLPPDHIYVPT